MGEIISTVVTRYMLHVNYRTITLLMTIESSFIPFPSEVIMPPAWRKAAEWVLNIYLVILAWTFGSLLGALFNYYIALRLGRKIIYKLADTRLAHLMLINRESIEKAEDYFRRNWAISTFIGRLLPAIRQLISLPAGLAKMNIWKFIFYTTLWAVIWNIILALAWYFLKNSRHKIEEYNHIFTLAIWWILWIVLIFFVGRYFYRKHKSVKSL